MRRDCDCPIPDEHGPIRPGYCRCGGYIDPRWTSNDRTFREFFDQLAALPGVTSAFVAQCRQRELDGRDEFGHQFLSRDNAAEAREEASDLALYCALSVLRARRDGNAEQIEAALDAAHHAALAYEITRRL